jgi:hypothetical protein
MQIDAKISELSNYTSMIAQNYVSRRVNVKQ